MSEQTPSKQPTAPGDPASGVEGGGEALSSKQPASNPYTVADYATGFMMGLEDRGWTKLDRDLEYDIREEVESLWDKLDVDGMEVRIGSLERALARVEGERDQQLRRVDELQRDRDRARNLVQTWQELAADVESERDRAKARIAELERERDEARMRSTQLRCELAQALKCIAELEASIDEENC